MKTEFFGLTREDDYATSTRAADSLKGALGTLRHRVLHQFVLAAEHGLTDGELHNACCLRHGIRDASTYRKRRTELSQIGFLERTAATRDNQGVYRIVSGPEIDRIKDLLSRMSDKDARAWVRNKIATATKEEQTHDEKSQAQPPESPRVVDGVWIGAAAYEICRTFALGATAQVEVADIIKKHLSSR